jgi:hypothetical protein
VNTFWQRCESCGEMGFARRERRHMQVWRQPRAETIILVIGGE